MIKESKIWEFASGQFLTEVITNDMFSTMSEEELYKFCEDHIIQAFEYSNGQEILDGNIAPLAYAIVDMLKENSIKVEED